MEYIAHRTTKGNIKVTAKVTNRPAAYAFDWYTEANGVYYDSGSAVGRGDQRRATEHARDAAQYLDTLTREEIEQLLADTLMHPDLGAALISAMEQSR